MLPGDPALSFAPRPDEKRPRPFPLTDAELARPTVVTVLKLTYNAFARMLHDPAGMVLGSAFLLLMIWGPHGRIDWLSYVWAGWRGPGSAPHARAVVLPGIPWDQEWLSFLAGFVLVVLVPMALIKWVFGHDLRDYGLGLPQKGRGRLAILGAVTLFLASLGPFYAAVNDKGMQATYPLYRGGFASVGEFLVYEAGYLLFFVAIEFIFRGYLLFGLFRIGDSEAQPNTRGVSGPLLFGYYAISISMLSYTAWHLGKPVPELWGTLVWGIATGTLALATRSIWPIVIVHWLLNVILDALIAWK
jgi:hypothetical protein